MALKFVTYRINFICDTMRGMNNIAIVLVNTTHPGNIGAVARAMKNMGLQQLYLVAPKTFPHVKATARAAGADDILAKAIVVENLDEAIVGCGLVIGTSARLRSLPWPLLNPKQCAEKALFESQHTKVAIVFGREHAGLTNQELAKCHYHIHIPTNPEFSSLNVAAAVQVVAYELRMMMEQDISQPDKHFIDELATAEEVQFFYQHLERALKQIDFLKQTRSRRFMLRLQRLFNRARLEKTELNILRGILTAMEKLTGRL